MEKLKKECKELGVLYLLDAYASLNKGKTVSELRETIIDNELINFAKENGYPYYRLLKVKLQKNINTTEVLKEFKARKSKTEKEKEIQDLKEKCAEVGVSIRSVYRYRQNNKELTYEQLIDIAKKHQEAKKTKTKSTKVKKTIQERCIEAGINYYQYTRCKTKNKDLSFEEIVEICLNQGKTFKDKCEEAGVKYNSAVAFRLDNKELTDEQVIEHLVNNHKKTKKNKRSGKTV